MNTPCLCEAIHNHPFTLALGIGLLLAAAVLFVRKVA